MPEFNGFYRPQNWALRGLFLTLIGPVIGTCAIVSIMPLLVLGFLWGWKIWLFIFAIGAVPSAAVAATTIILQIREFPKYVNIAATTLSGPIYTTLWARVIGHGAGDNGFNVFLSIPGIITAFFIGVINYQIIGSRA